MKLIGEIKDELQKLREKTDLEIGAEYKRKTIHLAINHVSNILSNIADDFLYFSKSEKGKT